MGYVAFVLFWTGVGVPILLSYVYCVVPISLCRSGGCGVSTTNSGGVRIDFDESDVPAGTGPGAFVGMIYSTDSAVQFIIINSYVSSSVKTTGHHS